LHLIHDINGAMRTLYRILKPGGVVLATVPGTVTPISRDEWGARWHWGFTQLALRQVATSVFPGESVEVEAHGNVLVGVAMLHGLAVHELSGAERDHRDPQFEVVITLRAVKQRIADVRRAAAVRRDETVGGPLVLAYHRIASPTSDPWALCVSVERFAEHLE